MKSVLMHKNISVAVIDYADGRITGVMEILNKEHMPVGTYIPGMTNSTCCTYLQAWQRSRAIPGDRTNLAAILDSSGKDIFQLGALAHGMGLTDQYWICGAGESTIWEEISFHKNGFRFSSLTLTGEGEVTDSPDYETNGSFAKAWILADGIPVLLKDSPDWLPTASANEAAACCIAQACGITHAIYYPVSFNGKVYCATPCFVDSDREEFVSLLQFMRTNWGAGSGSCGPDGPGQWFYQQNDSFRPAYREHGPSRRKFRGHDRPGYHAVCPSGTAFRQRDQSAPVDRERYFFQAVFPGNGLRPEKPAGDPFPGAGGYCSP